MTESRSNEIVVMTTNNGIARKWDKKHYCCYCLQPQSKLPRHLQTCHPDESDVCGFIQEKDKAARQKLLCKLRNLGNHLHNCEVKRHNRGTLIVGYRPSGHVNAEDYGPCPYCYGYYVMKDLWKHRWTLKPSRSTHDAASSSQSTGSKQLHERMMTKSKLLMPPPVGVRHELQALPVPMNSDTVSRAVKSDSLILELARREFLRVGHDKDQHNHIRNKLCELGRLLMQLRRNVNQPNALHCIIFCYIDVGIWNANKASNIYKC